MDFFDCQVIYGVPADHQPPMLVPNVQALQQEMARAGVTQALVRCHEQLHAGVVLGNERVAADVRATTNLWGVWAMLPPHTHEIPDPDRMLAAMHANRIVAWQFWPAIHGYCFHPRVCRDWFALAESAHVPICVDGSCNIGDRELLEVLEAHPQLTVILTLGVWPLDRRLRPFLQEFPNTYFSLTLYLTDGGIEELVETYGPERLLFGSGFHTQHFGGNMLMLRHAQIPEADKQQIAAGNLTRLIREIDYDQS